MMKKFIKENKIITGVAITLLTTAVITLANSAVKVELVDQREQIHYAQRSEQISEIGNDIKGIKKFLLTGKKEYLE